MSASLTTSPAPSKLAEVANRVRERCAEVQDTLDQWLEIGKDLDALACAFIAD
jgi:hypothetical protein